MGGCDGDHDKRRKCDRLDNISSSYEHRASQELVDCVDRTLRASVTARDAEQPIQERVLRMARVEAWKGSEVICGRADRLATHQCRNDLRWTVAKTSRGHVNERAIVCLERDTQVELENAVRSEERPVSTTGKYPSAQPRTLEMAFRDRCRDPCAVRSRADPLRAGNDDLQQHQQACGHVQDQRNESNAALTSFGCDVITPCGPPLITASFALGIDAAMRFPLTA